jgi:hypothetical protein
MADAVYMICALACFLCVVLLWRGYLRNRTRLLLWSSLCFAGLAVNNGLLFADKVLYPEVDMSILRSVAALVGLLLLLYGLIWDSD